jgi:hypothetical protein
MSKQTQKGRGLRGEVKGPLLRHTGKNNMCPLLVTWIVAWPGIVPTQGPHLLCSQITSQARVHIHTRARTRTHTHTHTHTYTHTLPPCSLNLRDTISHQTGLLGCLWEVIRLPFCLPKAGLLLETGFLLVWREGLPIDSRAFSGFLCTTKTHSLVHLEKWLSLAPGRNGSPDKPGM